MSERLDLLTERFTRGVIRWRWPIVLLSLVITAGIGSGARGLFFDTDYRAFFSDENPQLMEFETLQAVYTKNDNLLFVVAPRDGSVFTSDALTAIEELVDRAWELPFALRVDAVTNFQHTVAEEDDLVVGDLVEGADALSPELLAAARSIAINDPVLARRLVNEGASVTGVNVTLQFPGDEATEVTEAMAAARDLSAQIEEAYPEVELHITGIAALNNAFMEVSQEEMARLMPIMFLAMFFVMILALRSFSGTVATLALVGLSVVVAMGAAGFWKVGLTPPSAQAPIIIMTLAIADSIHVLVTMLKEMKAGRAKYDAIVESIRVNMAPVLLTSVSTVIGFLTLNFSDVPPFNHLGNMTAVGVVAAFVFSVTFLPALMAILPVRVTEEEEQQGALFARLGDFVVARRTPLLWGGTLAVIGATLLVPMNVLDDRFVEYFDDRVEFRTATDFTTDNLTGIYQVEFSLAGGESGSISEPSYLQTVEEFAQWYRAQPGVNHVATYTDVMKRLSRNMHGDDDAYYRLPESRELAAQYLLLYEMSLPYGLDLNNQINIDKSATRFTVTTNDISTVEIRELAVAGEEWLEGNAPAAMHSVASGPMVIFAYISGINIRSMLVGSIWALLLISALMVFALRSVRLGAMSFIPNLAPAAVAFGVWGLTVGVVNIGLSVVIGVTLGIVVDDSVHFMTKYVRARREHGLDPEDAVRYAFLRVGRAITVTTVILVIGFLILSTSAFDMNASMGRMTAMTLAIALAADVFLLPPLLMALDRRDAETGLIPELVPVAGD